MSYIGAVAKLDLLKQLALQGWNQHLTTYATPVPKPKRHRYSGNAHQRRVKRRQAARPVKLVVRVRVRPAQTAVRWTWS